MNTYYREQDDIEDTTEEDNEFVRMFTRDLQD